jgi:histidinol-phosphate/aromatic aminotransferase/cobyric acid decarboxylase-like protein
LFGIQAEPVPLDGFSEFVWRITCGRAEPSCPHSGAALAAALRAHDVLVRHFATPRIADYLRITVRMSTETDCLLDTLAHCPDAAGAV